MNKFKGFTLVELMIVVAIIAILSAIALPAYNGYRIKAAESACLGEAKAYANSALAMLYNDEVVSKPQVSVCQSISGGSALGESVAAIPKSPGVRSITCLMDGDVALGSCDFD